MGAWNCPRGCAVRNAHIGGHVDISRVFHRCFHFLLKSTLRVQTFQFYNYRSFFHFNIFNVWMFEENIEHMFVFASMILQLDKNESTHAFKCVDTCCYFTSRFKILKTWRKRHGLMSCCNILVVSTPEVGADILHMSILLPRIDYGILSVKIDRSVMAVM